MLECLDSNLSFINLDRIISFSFMAWISLLCLLSLICIISFGFFTNFDISDEGYHLYYNMFGASQTASMINMHFFTHPIGKLFNHNVLGYRFMTLFCMLSLSIYLAYSIEKTLFFLKKNSTQVQVIFYSMICITSLAFFTWIPSFEYNVFSIYSAIGWASSYLLHLHNRESSRNKNYFLFLTSFFIFTAILTKFTFGIPLFLISILLLIFHSYLFKTNHIKSIFLLSLFLCLKLGSIYILYPDYWERFLKICNFVLSNNIYGVTDNSGGGLHLINNYIHQIIAFSKKLAIVMFAFLILYTFLKKKSQFKNLEIFLKLLTVFFTSILAIKYIPPYDASNPRYLAGVYAIIVLYAVLFSVGVFYLIGLKGHPQYKKILFSCIVLIIILLHPTGTNNNFIFSSSIGLVGFGALFTILLFHITQNFNTQKTYIMAVIISLTSIIGYSITWDQILYYYRNGSFHQQNSYSKYSPYLKKIKIEKDLAHLIDTLWLKLDKINFNRQKDKIFAYTDLPGFLFSVGARSFGESWAITGYPNSYPRMCLHFDFEPIGNVRYIYILKINDIPLRPMVKNCLFKKIKPSPMKVKEHFIGKGWHYHSKIEMNLRLVGPYVLR